MDVLAVMCLGILAGRFLGSCSYEERKRVNLLTLYFSLNFFDGSYVGKKENFFEELSSLGWSSLLLFLIPTILSIILVFFLTEIFMKKTQLKGK